MISPPASTASSGAGTPKKGSLSSIESSEQITVIKQAPNKEDEAERALREAVEASITRQISVSREQRQLLGSLRGQTRRRKDSQPLPSGGIAMGRNERLAETKKLTPTLVIPGGGSDSPQPLHMHRRSERVVVEGA